MSKLMPDEEKANIRVRGIRVIVINKPTPNDTIIDTHFFLEWRQVEGLLQTEYIGINKKKFIIEGVILEMVVE